MLAVVVDAAAHLRAAEPPGDDPSRWTDDWPRGASLTFERYELEMADAGVEQAVLVTSIRADGVDNGYTLSSAARRPGTFVAVGNLDACDADTPAILARMVRTQSMAGARLYGAKSELAEDWLLDDRTVAVWETAQELGVPISVQRTRMSTVAALTRRMRAFPDVRVVLHRAAGVDLREPLGSPSATALLAMADLPGTRIVIGGDQLLPLAADEPPPLLAALLHEQRAERVLWGSYSLFRGARGGDGAPSLGQMVDHLRAICSFLDDDGLAQVLGGTARALYPGLRRDVGP